MTHFTGIGTVVNVLLIMAGSLIGIFLGKRFPEKIRVMVLQAAGLAVLFIGISGLLSAVMTVGEDGASLALNHTLAIVLYIIVGSVIGQLIDIEGALEEGGAWLQRKLQNKLSGGTSRLAEGFCMCTILYCAGAMAIVGSLNDALLGDAGVLYAKGIIDGVTGIVFASAMGAGVFFSAFGVGIYQGIITLLAALLAPLLTAEVVAQMSAVGSLIIVGISLNLMEIKRFRIGNMLPAIFLPLLWYGIRMLL